MHIHMCIRMRTVCMHMHACLGVLVPGGQRGLDGAHRPHHLLAARPHQELTPVLGIFPSGGLLLLLPEIIALVVQQQRCQLDERRVGEPRATPSSDRLARLLGSLLG